MPPVVHDLGVRSGSLGVGSVVAAMSALLVGGCKPAPEEPAGASRRRVAVLVRTRA